MPKLLYDNRSDKEVYYFQYKRQILPIYLLISFLPIYGGLLFYLVLNKILFSILLIFCGVSCVVLIIWQVELRQTNKGFQLYDDHICLHGKSYNWTEISQAILDWNCEEIILKFKDSNMEYTLFPGEIGDQDALEVAFGSKTSVIIKKADTNSLNYSSMTSPEAGIEISKRSRLSSSQKIVITFVTFLMFMLGLWLLYKGKIILSTVPFICVIMVVLAGLSIEYLGTKPNMSYAFALLVFLLSYVVITLAVIV